MQYKDYYEILGVKREASEQEGGRYQGASSGRAEVRRA